MPKHMTLSERIFIEKSVSQGMPFSEIGRKLNRAATTISREVKNRRAFTERWTGKTDNDCIYYPMCVIQNLCSKKCNCYYSRCKLCDEKDCRELCERYTSKHCAKLDKAPFVCNNCPQERTCKRSHAYYTAHRANAAYEKELSDCRKGIRLSPDKLEEIGDLILPLVEKGQSINHIIYSHSEEIGVSERTIYNYVSSGVFKVKNYDLPKKVVYRQRVHKNVLTHMEYNYRRGRTIEDFNAFLDANPGISVVEMDTVKSARGCKKCLLTMIFRKHNFMLIFLMKDGKESSVIEIFDMLTEGLGLTAFRSIFPVILTDNGVEFKAPEYLEFSSGNCRRTSIFYCDPQASWQKPHVEKNHVLIRRIIPKGTSFKHLNINDVVLLTNHINSVPREIFNNKTPFELITDENEKKLLELLGLSPVAPDDVILKPALLKLKSR